MQSIKTIFILKVMDKTIIEKLILITDVKNLKFLILQNEPFVNVDGLLIVCA